MSVCRYGTTQDMSLGRLIRKWHNLGAGRCEEEDLLKHGLTKKPAGDVGGSWVSIWHHPGDVRRQVGQEIGSPRSWLEISGGRLVRILRHQIS